MKFLPCGALKSTHPSRSREKCLMAKIRQGGCILFLPGTKTPEFNANAGMKWVEI